MNIEAANVFETANIPETPVGPSTVRNTLIGAALDLWLRWLLS